MSDCIAAFDGGNDGDEFGNAWRTGYFVTQDEGNFCLWYGDPATGNGDGVGEAEGYPTLVDAQEAAQDEHDAQCAVRGMPITELSWGNVDYLSHRGYPGHRNDDDAPDSFDPPDDPVF